MQVKIQWFIMSEQPQGPSGHLGTKTTYALERRVREMPRVSSG